MLKRMPLLLVVVLAPLGLLFAFGGASDAVFAMYDPVFYAMGAEDLGVSSLNGHHPGFHALVLLLVQPLKAAGVHDAGFWACQSVAACGFAAILAAFAAAAGWRIAGLGILALFVSLKGVLLETAGGETVMPALGAMLWCLLTAADKTSPPRRLFWLCVLALLLRQDSLLMLPAVLWMQWRVQGMRVKGLCGFTLRLGLTTAALYALSWWSSGTQRSLLSWLLQLLEVPARTWADGVSLPLIDRILVHVSAHGVAAVGSLQHGSIRVLALASLVAPAIFALLATLLRGDNPQQVLARGALITIAARAAFTIWFEPANWEWTVFALALTGLACAALLRGAPLTPAPSRVAAIMLALCAAAAALSLHGGGLMRLREPVLSGSATECRRLAGDSAACAFMDTGLRTSAAWVHQRVPPQHFELAGHGSLEAAAADLVRQSPATAAHVCVLLDRNIGTSLGTDPKADLPRWIEELDQSYGPALPGVRVLKRNGLVTALFLTRAR